MSTTSTTPRSPHASRSTVAAVAHAFAWLAISRDVPAEMFSVVLAATWEGILLARGWVLQSVISTPEGPIAYWHAPPGAMRLIVRVRRESTTDAQNAYDQLVGPLALHTRQSPGEVVATALAVQHLAHTYPPPEAMAMVQEFMARVNRAQMVAMFTSAPPPEERAPSREERPDGVSETLAPEKVTPKTVTAKVAIGEPEWAPKMREWFEAYPSVVKVAVDVARAMVAEAEAAGKTLGHRAISARDIGRRIQAGDGLRRAARGALGEDAPGLPKFQLYYAAELGARMRAAEPSLAKYMASTKEP